MNNLQLVLSLGRFFGIQVLLTCLDSASVSWDQVDPLVSSLPWPAAFPATAAELPGLLPVSSGSGPVLVACQSINFSDVRLARRHFESNIVWLIPSTPDNMLAAEELPLSLNSNLLLYSDGDLQEKAVDIVEVYSVKLLSKRNNFGTWTPEKGLIVPQPSTWERRKNLTGITLINTVLEWNPMNMLANGTTIGLFPEVLSALQQVLSFRYAL